MNDDIKKFKILVNYLISQGSNLTKIAKESGLNWPTLDAIMKDKQQNFQASTLATIQDFIRKHNTGSINLNEKLPKSEFKEENTNFSVLEFFVRVRELLQNVPKGYKCKIEIEKT